MSRARRALAVLGGVFPGGIALSQATQQRQFDPVAADALRAVNRQVSPLQERPGAVRMDARAGNGIAWSEGSDFAEGIIEVDVPDDDWPRLRKEFPEEVENPVDASVLPTDWSPLRIVVKGSTVQVYVGRDSSPTLEVRKLVSRTASSGYGWVTAVRGSLRIFE